MAPCVRIRRRDVHVTGPRPLTTCSKEKQTEHAINPLIMIMLIEESSLRETFSKSKNLLGTRTSAN